MIFQNCLTKFHEPLGEWNLEQFWNITNGIYAKYHVQIMLLFVYIMIREISATCEFISSFFHQQICVELLAFSTAALNISPHQCLCFDCLTFVWAPKSPEFQILEIFPSIFELRLEVEGCYGNCNFHMKVFQIKLKYHWPRPIRLQKFPWL